MDKTKNKVLPKRMQLLRENRNWTKTDVAKKIGRTLSTYANWEYGIREPDTEMIKKIAEVYEVSVDYLLGRTDNPNTVEINDDEKEFFQAIENLELKRWILELPKSSEEDLEKLRTMWNLIKGEKK